VIALGILIEAPPLQVVLLSVRATLAYLSTRVFVNSVNRLRCSCVRVAFRYTELLSPVPNLKDLPAINGRLDDFGKISDGKGAQSTKAGCQSSIV
jgi:hypothetical protein